MDYLQVKRVPLDDLEATYCCMKEIPPERSWAEALPESKEWIAFGPASEEDVEKAIQEEIDQFEG